MFIADDEPYNNINKSSHPFIKEYMRTVSKYAPLWWKYQEEFPEVFQEVFSRYFIGTGSGSILLHVPIPKNPILYQFKTLHFI